MKGTIVRCIQELVEEKFGTDTWRKIVKQVDGMPMTILPIADIEDAKVMELIKTVCVTANLTGQQVADAFGEYWVNHYAQKYYPSFFRNNRDARSFILSMDDVHTNMTRNMANAHPPKFVFTWKNDKTLQMSYLSERGMIDFAVSLLKGVAKFYKENLTITKLSSQMIEVIFP